MQKPHPPILIGGNSRRAIRRAVELGDAWNPFPTASTTVAATSRTADLETDEDLARSAAILRELSEQAGRDVPPEIELAGLLAGDGALPSSQLVDRLGRYAELGVTAVGVTMEGRTSAEWCDNAERFGAEVIAKLS